MQLVRVANVLFAVVLGAFWLAWRVFGPAIEARRPFVWAIYVMVELYAVLMIGVFWTYVNDIVTTSESCTESSASAGRRAACSSISSRSASTR
jgi:hypothetical protein